MVRVTQPRVGRAVLWPAAVLAGVLLASACSGDDSTASEPSVPGAVTVEGPWGRALDVLAELPGDGIRVVAVELISSPEDLAGSEQAWFPELVLDPDRHSDLLDSLSEVDSLFSLDTGMGPVWVLAGRFDPDVVADALLEAIGPHLSIDELAGQSEATLIRSDPDGPAAILTPSRITIMSNVEQADHLVGRRQSPGDSIVDVDQWIPSQIAIFAAHDAAAATLVFAVPDARPESLVCGFACSPEQLDEVIAQIDDELVGDLRHTRFAIGYGEHDDIAIVVLVHDDHDDALVTLDGLTERLTQGTSLATKRPWTEQLRLEDITSEGPLVVATLTSSDPTLDVSEVLTATFHQQEPLLLPWDPDRARQHGGTPPN